MADPSVVSVVIPAMNEEDSIAAIRALYRCTSPTPCSCAATRAAGTPNTASTREMCSSKKSIIGHCVVCRT